MGRGVGEEARQRNGAAVQRLFRKSASLRAAPTTPSTGGSTVAERADSGATFRMASTSAAALVGETGGTSGAGQPAWCAPERRALLSRATLDVPSHLSQQLELAAEMGTLTPAQQQALSSYAAPTYSGAAAAAQKLAEVEGANRSRFLLEVQKARHARSITAPPADAALTPYEASRAQWKAYHHQQAVLRHEQSIPRRRAIDPYVQLTGAQVDVALTVPNMYTVDRLVERNGGRWVLDNPHRQQLYRGEPVMTRIMHGDFYGEGAARRAAGTPRHDVLATNRRDVRVTSEINRAERLRRQAPTCNCARTK